MFARVSTLQAAPKMSDEGARNFREQVVPNAKKLKGFKGAYLLVDRKSGKAIAITLWNSEADMKASAERANQLRSQAAQVTSGTIQSVEEYEVAEHA